MHTVEVGTEERTRPWLARRRPPPRRSARSPSPAPVPVPRAACAPPSASPASPWSSPTAPRSTSRTASSASTAPGPRAPAGDGGPGAVVVARDMRPSGPELVAAFAEGVTERRAVDVVDIGLASTDQLYFASGTSTCPARCSPRATTRRSTTASSCAAPGASPVGQDTGLAEIRDLGQPSSTDGYARTPAVPLGEVRARRARRLRRVPALARRRSRASARCGRRRRRQRDGRAHRACGRLVQPGSAAAAGGRPAVLRARRHLPQPRGEPDRPGEPARPAAAVLERGRRPRAWPSTATPTAASSSTSAASVGDPSTLTALIAVRELAKEPGATVIHNLITSGRCPRSWSRERRHPRAHAGGPLVHQGDDGRDRRGLRRRALRALLLPRLLARRLRHARGAARPRRAGRDPAGTTLSALLARVLPLRRQRGDQHQVADQAAVLAAIRAAFRPSPASPSSTSSTAHRDPHRRRSRLVVQRAARATPSRCCALNVRDDE
jgi:hypothetical protein